jgi:hypothetical protein
MQFNFQFVFFFWYSHGESIVFSSRIMAIIIRSLKNVQSRALNLGRQGHFEISRHCHKLKILPA